jgi:hypothetical protein
MIVLWIVVLICFCASLPGQANDQVYAGKVSPVNLNKVNPDSVTITFPKYHLSVSNFACGSIGLGMTKQTSTRCREDVVCAYKGVGVFGDMSVVSSGLYYQINYFKKPQPSGFFLTAQLGVMQYSGKELISTTEGTESHEKEGFAPIAAFGLGLSSNYSKTSCIRLSLDGGVKMSPINLNITIVF